MIDALLDSWASAPTEEISVRTLVHKAAAAQGAIHYHFGSIERLYLSASEVALDRAQAWMDARLALLAMLEAEPLAPGLQASLIAATIADWTGEQRRLAAAWRHAPTAQWQVVWDRFWDRFAAVLGLGGHAAALACFAAGEAARHLLVWNPPLDRALLEETVSAFIVWLREHRQVPDRVRPTYQALARRGYDAPPALQDEQATALAGAAAALLAANGHQGVTFRAVAARAGVTLGKVIHVYKTKSALLHAALHSLYEREALRGDADRFLARTLAPDTILEALLEAVVQGGQPVLAAYDEIERAICNGADHAALRGVLRAMEDPSGAWALRQLLGGMPPSQSLVAAFSAIVRGIGQRALFSGEPRAALRSHAVAALRPFRQ